MAKGIQPIKKPPMRTLWKMRQKDKMTFQAMADHFSVSTMTITRWLDDYGIPRPRTEDNKEIPTGSRIEALKRENAILRRTNKHLEQRIELLNANLMLLRDMEK